MAFKIKLVKVLWAEKTTRSPPLSPSACARSASETIQPDNEATKGKIKKISHLIEGNWKRKARRCR